MLVGYCERKLGLNLSWLLKNSGWVIFGRNFRMLTAMIITILLARLVSRELFGQHQILLSIFLLASIFALPGFNGSLFRALARARDGTLKEVIKISLKWSVLGVISLLGAGIYFLNAGEGAIGISLVASSLFFPLFHVFNRWEVVFNAKEQFKTGAKYSVLLSLALLLVMTASIYFFRDNLFLIFMAFVLTSSVVGLLCYKKSLKYLQNKRIEKGWRRSGYMLALAHGFGLLYAHADKLILGYFLGVNAVAVYVIAVTFGDTLKSLLQNMVVVYKPMLFRFGDVEVLRLLRRQIIVVGAALVLSVFVLWWAVPVLITLVFSSAYAESIVYSQVYLMTLPFSVMGIVLGEVLIKMKRELHYFYSNLAAGVINISLYVLLIPLMGVMGAIAASILFYFVQFALRYVIALRVVRAKLVAR